MKQTRHCEPLQIKTVYAVSQVGLIPGILVHRFLQFHLRKREKEEEEGRSGMRPTFPSSAGAPPSPSPSSSSLALPPQVCPTARRGEQGRRPAAFPARAAQECGQPRMCVEEEEEEDVCGKESRGGMWGEEKKGWGGGRGSRGNIEWR